MRLPIGTLRTGPLRRGQLGALHALAASYSIERRRPSVVVMPTGSGKTGVMMATPFLTGAERVLVVTPSRLVRTQITEEFRTMRLLRHVGLLPDDDSSPRVKEIEKRLAEPEDWKALRNFDVVVTTPNSASPAYEAVASPPEDLFDLVLVDEAHHSPARTWNGLLDSFPSAKRVLFTATPFRRDEGEIRGEFVYIYPVEEAVDDGIFRRIDYLPVEPTGQEDSSDVAIAKMAESVFLADSQAGLQHSVLVRTDEKKRANQLANIYAENTSLRLKTIHSGLHYSTVKRTINLLRAGELDGIICVDMLGEGFDFPNLKIAAVHAPHRSLAVTMQFIGRFARSGSDTIGTAKFIAIENDIRIASVELYEEGAVWEQLVPNLLTSGIGEEVRTRRILDTFEAWEYADGEDEIQDISLYTLHPYHHIVAYEIYGNVDLDTVLEVGASRSIEHRWTSEAQSTTIFITKERTRPPLDYLERLPKHET